MLEVVPPLLTFTAGSGALACKACCLGVTREGQVSDCVPGRYTVGPPDPGSHEGISNP